MKWALIAVFAVICIGLNLYRRRRGGPGPGINGWMPRFMRPRINARYRAHGWQEPYNADGSRNWNRSPV